ncbi:YadA-like family protein, partial [Streptobacillus felis]|uniref:YadA-like family protein n=2 Tax=Streptobacillus felis TaxID=1384509 RepID=UPI000A83D23D
KIRVEYGEKGLDGNDGANGETKTRIIYEKPNGEKETVATLKDGLKFAGDNGTTVIDKKLNEKLEIVGGADETKLSDRNIGINAKEGKLEVKLSKELTGLTSSEFKNASGDTTTINGNGITIDSGIDGKANVSLTSNGLDNGGNKITNVADGEVSDTSKEAVNGSQLNAVKKEASKHTTVSVDGGDKDNKDGDANGNLVLTETENANGGKHFDIKLADKVNLGTGDNKVVVDGTNANIVVGEGDKAITVNGKTGTVNGLNNKTWSPTNFVKGQAASEDQLKSLYDTVNENGWNIKSEAGEGGKLSDDSDNNASLIKKDKTVTMKAGKNLVVKQSNDGQGNASVEFSLDKDIKDINTITLGTPGENGKPGTDGKIGISGKDGKDAVSISGKDGIGTIGLNGKDGASATITVEKAKPNLDNKDSENGKDDRIVYTDSNNKKQEVATMNDGLRFAGDNKTDKVINRKLNETLEIVGGADKTKLSDGNIGVNATEDGKLEVKLSKEITGLTSAEFKNQAGDTTTLNSNGITINPIVKGEGKKEVTLTKDGLNNGGNQIVNVDSGLKNSDGTSVDLNVAEGDILNNAANISDLKKSRIEITANGGKKANDNSTPILLTSKKANDGHLIYDVSLATTSLTSEKGGKVLVPNSVDANKIVNAGDVAKAINTLGNNTIKFGGDDETVTEAQSLNSKEGIKFDIKGSEYIKSIASGSEIALDLSDEAKDKLDKVVAANAGISSAVAMANLPQVSNIAGHRHNIAGAYGYYNGEHAFALGLSGLNETGNLVYKASGSLNTKGHVALGAGLGYQFDKLESRRKDMLTLQRHGNINLLDEKVYELENTVNELKAKNEEFQNQMTDLQKEVKELKELLNKVVNK